MAQEPFVGLDPSITTEYAKAAQLLPVNYDNTNRAISYAVGENAMQLGQFTVPADHMIYMIRMNLDNPVFVVSVHKGQSDATKTPLFTLTSDGINVTVEKQKNYINEVEAYLDGNILTVFGHISPSLYYPSTSEYYYVASDVTGSIVADALFANGYHSGFIEGVKDEKPPLLTKCRAETLEIDGPFDWAAWELIWWTSWDQDDISFAYMEEKYPDATMVDFE